jgi:hypothetical protein
MLRSIWSIESLRPAEDSGSSAQVSGAAIASSKPIIKVKNPGLFTGGGPFICWFFMVAPSSSAHFVITRLWKETGKVPPCRLQKIRAL